ncbi:MFS transporter [Luteipulveratus mongoliensis]|uniref:Major facilitator superfamily (MFS) profile domain-containing protein n=1 Tax=Luteipulveratus mongoliensis TaxID=571913 RepID=A0A0K1JM53_9MICO|nr:MFS transporter [Luteipulveratus mongoliensis]AKU17789.1 hypothetical protein VV02_21250 [Luteipulveratus mongoliensis]
MTTTTAPAPGPVLIGDPPPPVSRDRMMQLWVAASATSLLGDAAFTIALTWTAIHLLSPGLAGLVVAIELIPQALLMLVGGVIADRLDTRKVLVAGQAARTVVLLLGAFAWSYVGHSAAILVAVALSFGVVSGLTQPSAATLSRQLVHGDDLGTVIGWSQISGRMAQLLGAPVGAVVVARAGLGPAMLLDAATYVIVVAVLVLRIRPRFRLPRTVGEPWLAAMRGGLTYLARTPSARTLVIGLCSLNIFISPVSGIGVALRVSRSGWPAVWVGIVEVSFGIAAIAGSMLAIRWQGRRTAARGFWGLVLQGAGLAAVGVPTRGVVIAGAVVVGLTAGMASVWLSAAFQRTIAVSHLGRVSSVNRLGDLVLIPVMTPVFGMLAAGTGVLTSTIVFGVGMSILCLWFATRTAITRLD